MEQQRDLSRESQARCFAQRGLSMGSSRCLEVVPEAADCADDIGFHCVEVDSSIYVFNRETVRIIMPSFVDDIYLAFELP